MITNRDGSPKPDAPAFEWTLYTLFCRARNHRRMVVAVCFWLFASVLAAWFYWPWFPLLGFAGLIPICGIGMLLDAHLMDRWQAKICNDILHRSLRMQPLWESLSAVGELPTVTWTAMLTTMVSIEHLKAFDQLSLELKSSHLQQRRNQLRALQWCTLGSILSLTLASISFVWAIAKFHWLAVVGVALGLAFDQLTKRSARRISATTCWLSFPKDQT